MIVRARVWSGVLLLGLGALVGCQSGPFTAETAGALDLTVTTRGTPPTAPAYRVEVRTGTLAAPAATLALPPVAVPPGGRVALGPLPPGPLVVRLVGIPAGCRAASPNPFALQIERQQARRGPQLVVDCPA
jgi:hypothetical protein